MGKKRDDKLEKSTIPPRRQKRNRRVWPFILVVISFIISAVGGAIFASNAIETKVDTEKKLEAVIQEEGLIKAKDKTTVLIMGVDERKDDVGRSDTMMIATLDPQTDRAALLSIPRDTRVKIKNRGYDKINAAFAYGGEQLAENTVESFLGIDINHYVIVNTKAFVRLIDAIGGIDINVTKRMEYEDPWDDDGGLVIDIYPGMQHMDGATAVTYVRYRDDEGDIGRVRRQQEFIAACVDKVTTPSIITKIPAIIREVIDAVQTDLSFKQILELAGAMKDAQRNGLEMEMVPGRPLYIDGISYWIPDVEQLRLSVADTLGIQVDPLLRERFERAASEYKSSIPSNAADIPENENSIGSAIKDSRAHRRERSSNYSNTRQPYDSDNRDYFESRSSINEKRDNRNERSRSSETTERLENDTNSNERSRRSETTRDNYTSNNSDRGSTRIETIEVPYVDNDESDIPNRSDVRSKNR